MSGPLAWTWGRFDALAAVDVHDLLALRSAVFVVEQECVFLDADGLDRGAWHLLGRVPTTQRDAPGPLAAYLRCLAPGARYAEASIGRVVIAMPWRRTGLGRELMHEGIGRARALWPGRAVRIGAQARLEDFYASLGFRSEGDRYDEDGIEHVEMVLEPARIHEETNA